MQVVYNEKKFDWLNTDFPKTFVKIQLVGEMLNFPNEIPRLVNETNFW